MAQQWIPPSYAVEWKPPDYAVESNEPQSPMNFARVNGQDVPVDDEPLIKKAWTALNEPLVNARGSMQQATDSFAKEHPIIGGIGNFALDTLSSLTSPLSLGLTALIGGANVAERAGLSGIAKLLHTPGRAAAGGMVIHGGMNAIDLNDEHSTAERVGGGIEAGLGALGLRGLRAPQESVLQRRLNAIPNQAPDVFPSVDETASITENLGKAKLRLERPTLPEPVQQLRDSLMVDEQNIRTNPQTGQSFAGDAPQRESLLGGESGKLMIYTRPKFVHPIPAVNNLFEAIRSAKPQVEAQERLYSQERARRIAASESVTTRGEAGARESLSKLAGEMPRVQMQTDYPMTQQNANILFDMITSSNRITPFEKATGRTGLFKILSGGELPQRSELNVLGRIFGPELAGEVVQMHGGLGVIRGSGKALMETSNLMKTMMASTDVSAPLRQGLPLAYRGEYWRAFDDMFKSLVSEKQFQGLMQSLEARPNFLIGREAGLQLTDLDSITSREEQFLSKIAEKIPGVRASERAYVGFLDKLRADTFDSLLADAVKAGGVAEEVAPGIARFVNVSTGRGSLGRFEKNAAELNALLFSPRLISSRLTMLNPAYYVNQTPQLRKEAIKALLSIAGGGLTITGLTKLGSEAVNRQMTVNTNPVNSDFGKAKVGNTRIDPYAGFQQYIVAASRLLTGKEQSSTSGKEFDLTNPKFGQPNRLDVLSNFAQSKLSPMASLVDVLLKGKDPAGKPVNTSKEVKDRFIPLFIQDVMDLYKDDPSLLPLGIEAAFGTGMSTYK